MLLTLNKMKYVLFAKIRMLLSLSFFTFKPFVVRILLCLKVGSEWTLIFFVFKLMSA